MLAEVDWSVGAGHDDDGEVEGQWVEGVRAGAKMSDVQKWVLDCQEEFGWLSLAAFGGGVEGHGGRRDAQEASVC